MTGHMLLLQPAIICNEDGTCCPEVLQAAQYH